MTEPTVESQTIAATGPVDVSRCGKQDPIVAAMGQEQSSANYIAETAQVQARMGNDIAAYNTTITRLNAHLEALTAQLQDVTRARDALQAALDHLEVTSNGDQQNG